MFHWLERKILCISHIHNYTDNTGITGHRDQRKWLQYCTEVDSIIRNAYKTERIKLAWKNCINWVCHNGNCLDKQWIYYKILTCWNVWIYLLPCTYPTFITVLNLLQCRDVHLSIGLQVAITLNWKNKCSKGIVYCGGITVKHVTSQIFSSFSGGITKMITLIVAAI